MTEAAIHIDHDLHAAEIVRRVQAELAEGSLSQSQIAREIGVSAGAVSQVIKGTYRGDYQGLIRRLRQWLDARESRRETIGRMPEAPAYVDTPSARRITSALSYAQMAGDITVIYGGAGTGKTHTALTYQSQHPSVHVVTMSPATSSVATALEEISETLGITQAGAGAARQQRAIIRRLARSQGLLIIDEAQHLGIQALDAMRSVHDATGIGMALIGNEQVYSRMTGGSRAAYLDRLFSRVGKRVRLTRASAEDIDALVDAWEITDPTARKTLRTIGQRPGGLRGLTKTLRLAALFAAGDDAGGHLQVSHIRAAWADLGGEA
jgi:DNA transposition AAA+ family ATPase